MRLQLTSGIAIALTFESFPGSLHLHSYHLVPALQLCITIILSHIPSTLSPLEILFHFRALHLIPPAHAQHHVLLVHTSFQLEACRLRSGQGVYERTGTSANWQSTRGHVAFETRACAASKSGGHSSVWPASRMRVLLYNCVRSIHKRILECNCLRHKTDAF